MRYLLLILLLTSSLSAQSDFRTRANFNQVKVTAEDLRAEATFGRNLAARILGRYKLLGDEKINRYVSLVGAGAASVVGNPETHYFFGILDTPHVNAYACPGGYIFVTKGALQLMKNEAQLVGVLCHEIAHINRKHVVRKLNIRGKDGSVVSGLSAAIGGGTSTARAAMAKMVDQALSLLLDEGIGKQEELEADADGVEMMATLGYDWKSYQQFIAGLNSMTLSKTHPSVDERLSRIRLVSETNRLPQLGGRTNVNRFNENTRS